MGLRIMLSWGCGSDRALTYEAGGPEFHLQHQRKPARTLDLGDQGRMEWESGKAAGAQDCMKEATLPRPGPQRSLD